MMRVHAQNKPIYREHWYIISPHGAKLSANPVKAKIYVLTNRHSYSSAWMFTRVIRQLPNGCQAGEPTGINGYYSEPRTVLLHQGLRLTFPIGANLYPNAHLGERFIPNCASPLADAE